MEVDNEKDVRTKAKKKKLSPLSVKDSVMGARIFYFFLYGLFYLSLCLYSN